MHVSVGKVRRGSGGKEYYLKLSREDYYLNAGSAEGVGRWWGRLASDLDLSGEVRKRDYCLLHDGYSPDKAPLSRNVGHPKRRPAFDITHSVVKDASIIASIDDRWRERIFQEVVTPAVEVSLRYFEREACRSRRGHDGADLVQGRGFVGARFNHIAARDVDGVIDPQAHQHCVLFNTTRGPDGQYRTLDGAFLFHHAQAAAALASVEEGYQLERLGFELRRVGRTFRIVGLPGALREEASGRAQQIREHAGPGATAEERARANWETRKPKEAIDVPKLLADWRERNERHGLTPDRVQELSRHRPRERDVLRELQEATAEALKQACRNESTFTARKFLELAALESQCRGVGADDVRLHVWGELEKSRLGLTERLVYRGLDRDGQERWTTRDLFDLERKILEIAASTRREPSGVTRAHADRAIAEKATLTPDQEKAVRGLTENRGRLQCLLGGAGTGKTFALDAVRIAHEAAGYRCLGTAVANRAARGLGSDAHMEVMNTKKILYEIDRGRLKLDGVCLFLDEAATTDTREMARIVLEVRKARHARLIAVGDHRQHNAVGPSGVFLGLCARLGSQELTEIIRQRNDEDKRMVAAFRDRKTAQAIGSLARRDRLAVGEEVSDSQALLVKKWGEDGSAQKDKRILASTNKQVDLINERCQKLRRTRGEISGEGVPIKGEHRAYVGERILLRKNAPLLDVANGDVATVLGADPKRDELRVRLDDGGRVVTIPLATYGRESVALGYAATSFLSQGASYESAYLFIHGRMSDAQTAYVMGSRHRERCFLVTTRDDAGENFATLVRDLGRDSTKR